MAEEDDGGVRKRKRDGSGGGEAVVGAGYYEKELEVEQYKQGVAEESVEEVMLWLDMEIALAEAGKDGGGGGAVDDGDAGFVTINGNEESCGPSFSCAASTVMASVDTRAGAPPPPTAVPWPWPSSAPAEASSTVDDEDVTDMAAEFDEAWLVELLDLTGGTAPGPDKSSL